MSFPCPSRRCAFSLVETMVSMGASVIILGGLLMSSLSFQKAVHASEQYAGSYSDQRRLIDYFSRDLRRSVSIAATDSSGVRHPVTGGTVAVADRATLILTLPGYYKSESPQNTGYDDSLEVVGTDERLDYGTTGGLAPTVEISFRKVFLSSEGCVCFLRKEAPADEIIVRNAENLFAEVTVGKGGRSAVVKAWFRTAYSNRQPLVSTFDEILLRNPPLDLHP